MTPEQKVLVQTSFAKVVPIADLAASLFYTRLFEMDPGLRVIFKGDMAEQGRKLMKALTLTVSSLDRLAELTPIIQMMGARGELRRPGLSLRYGSRGFALDP